VGLERSSTDRPTLVCAFMLTPMAKNTHRGIRNDIFTESFLIVWTHPSTYSVYLFSRPFRLPINFMCREERNSVWKCCPGGDLTIIFALGAYQRGAAIVTPFRMISSGCHYIRPGELSLCKRSQSEALP